MTPERPQRMGSADCPHEPDTVAWIQGELDSRERRAFEAHLEGCASCQELAAEATAILAGLGAGHAAPAPRMRRRAVHGLSALGAIAATLLLVLVVSDGPSTSTPDVTPGSGTVTRTRSIPRAGASTAELAVIEWMESRLGADGSWDESALTGFGDQKVGMHALALLALTQAADAEHGATEIGRAAGWLARQQDESGLIGPSPEFGRFDHPVATMALLEAWRVTGDEGLRQAADRAVLVLSEDPASPGLLRGGGAGQATWTVGTLMRADALGWPGLEPGIRRARLLLAGRLPRGLDGDCLGQESFWAAALGPTHRSPDRPVESLYGASVALLAAR